MEAVKRSSEAAKPGRFQLSFRPTTRCSTASSSCNCSWSSRCFHVFFFRDFLSSKMMPHKRFTSCYICPRVSKSPDSEDNGDFESTSTMSWFLEFPQHPTVKNTMSKAICLWSTAHNRFQPRLGRNLRNGDSVELVTERCNIRKVLPCLDFALFRALP